MEKETSIKTINKKAPYLNGNNTKVNGSAKRKNNFISASIKDHIVTSDGRVFYPCQFCNKVFPIKKSRTFHIKKCPAKEYILSIDDKPKAVENVTQKPLVKSDIPEVKKPSNKIDIKQNIVLNNQMNVSEILAKTQAPPIKLTIRRSPNNNGSEMSNHFTVTSSLILKEKNESNDEFSTIAKRLENNSVTITRQIKKEAKGVNIEKKEVVEKEQKIEKQEEPRKADNIQKEVTQVQEKIQTEEKTQKEEETQKEEVTQKDEVTQKHEETQKQEEPQKQEETQNEDVTQKEEESQEEHTIQKDEKIGKEEKIQKEEEEATGEEEAEEEEEEEEGAEEEESDEGTETSCRECTKDFESPLELLRHARKSHSYPRVLMALSEVKKFYSTKDRSQCPICHKPLKNKFRSAFVKHLHTHTNEMKYSCTVCKKKFRRSDHMKAHEKRHIVKDKK